MTFDTWKTYNTDEAYKDKDTTARGLVAAYKKDNPEGTREDFYSKLNGTWKKDKDGHVKEAVDEAFKVEGQKAETPAPTPVETPKSEETIELKKRDKEYLDNQNKIADAQEKTELNKVLDNKDADYAQTYDTIKRSGELFRNIDDHAVNNLPTFMIKRYMDGEFGDLSTREGKKEAKTRLAYFLLNGIQSKLKNASNAAALAAGRAPMFSDTMSDYEKYQQTNFANALENRWNKYKQDTQAAIDLAKQRNMSEEDAYDSIKKITRNQKLNTAFNMMNENQKLYLMNVTKEIGDKIGSFDNDELIDFLTGAAISGDKLTWQEAAGIAAARFAPGIIQSAKENKGKVNGNEKPASVGGAGNLKGYKTIDGETVDFNFWFNDKNKGKEKLEKLTKDLSEKYYNGEIDENTFREYFTPLYEEGKKHSSIKVFSPDEVIKNNNTNRLNELNTSFEELNENAGLSSYEDYVAEYDDIIANAKKWGASDKLIKSLEKNKLTKDQHAKKVQKANKKK